MDEAEKNRAEELRLQQQRAAREQEEAAQEEPVPIGSQANSLNALAPSDIDSQGADAGFGQPESRPWQAAGGEVPAEPSGDRDVGGSGANVSGGGEDSTGSQDSPATRREQLRASTASAAMAALAGDASGSATDIDGQITKQTSKLNHWMWEAEVEMVGSDFSTVGLSLIVTLPTRLIFATVLALELRHALGGTTSMIPYFPTLTWESFSPPSVEISNPLTPFFLYVAVVAYILSVIGACLFLAFIIAVAMSMAVGGEAAALDAASHGFEFLKGLSGS